MTESGRIDHGVTDENYVRPLRVDNDGRPEVAPQSVGWINGAWQKNPLRFGYSDTVEHRITATMVAGTNNLNATVPAGEIWVINNTGCRYDGSAAAAAATIAIIRGGNEYRLWQMAVGSLKSSEFYGRTGEWIAKPGDTLRLIINLATAGDSAQFHAVGYRVDIDQ